jgi:hypothetical protein
VSKPQVIDDQENERVFERVAAVDVAKAAGMVCTRVPHPSRPGTRQSAVCPRTRNAKGNGNAYLRGYLGQAAIGAAATATFPGERYRRIARRRGKARAQVAVAHSILIIIWHLLADPEARYADLGPGHYERKIDKNRKARTHIRQLEALGYTVTITSAA